MEPGEPIELYYRPLQPSDYQALKVSLHGACGPVFGKIFRGPAPGNAALLFVDFFSMVLCLTKTCHGALAVLGQQF